MGCITAVRYGNRMTVPVQSRRFVLSEHEQVFTRSPELPGGAFAIPGTHHH